MTARVPRGDAVALLRELARVDTRNPSLAPDAAGEGEAARLLAAVLRDWGFRVELHEALPSRPNVVARVGEGRAGARTLMLNGHLDVVGVEGMTHAPFAAEERDGRLYARGAADMKGGVAAMCAAAVRAADAGLAGEIVVAAVVDEELGSAGTRDLVTRGVRADAAVVTEPTGLAVMPAHKGFAWMEVEVRGRAAHGSRWDIGVDAIRHAGLLLAELDRVDAEELPRRTHPLLGRGSLHASHIQGGSGMSTYPERCVLAIERRTLPGEDAEEALAEVRAACALVRARRATFDAKARLTLAQRPSDVPADAAVVRALGAALGEEELPLRVEGMSAWTDCALLNDAGIPAVCFGPGDMGLAHAAEEFIPLAEVERATHVLTRMARAWCGGGGGTRD